MPRKINVQENRAGWWFFAKERQPDSLVWQSLSTQSEIREATVLCCKLATALHSRLPCVNVVSEFYECQKKSRDQLALNLAKIQGSFLRPHNNK